MFKQPERWTSSESRLTFHLTPHALGVKKMVFSFAFSGPRKVCIWECPAHLADCLAYGQRNRWVGTKQNMEDVDPISFVQRRDRIKRPAYCNAGSQEWSVGSGFHFWGLGILFLEESL